jgi:hypothetical protein
MRQSDMQALRQSQQPCKKNYLKQIADAFVERAVPDKGTA